VTSSKPLRVAIYERVSRAHQATALQTDEIGAFVERRGWKVVKRYVDHGVSGARDRRPELDKMLADARAGKFDVIVVFKTDRLARSLRHLVTMLDELASNGVGFVSITEPFDTTSPSGRLLLQIVGAMAEFERSLIVERTRAGVAAARRRGAKIGRPRARIDLDRALELRAAGKSIREAAKVLGVGAATLSRALSKAARETACPARCG
jgi:DNA invertase Pin-like site-specific DNA recombinase